jgi:hypothetical protein
MIADGFDRRSIANMEVALERACKGYAGAEQHAMRQLIAAEIVKCAKSGDTTLNGLTRAGKAAAAKVADAKRFG